MKKYFIHTIRLLLLLAGALGVLFNSCVKNPTEGTIINKPPETFLWADTIGRVLTSQVTLRWWGDDPDGFVLGYYVTVDGINWKFTTANDSTFTISIGSKNLDTIKIQVAAVDKEGNGTYDAIVKSGGINFGVEPFSDKDSNGVYSHGESFVDIGLVDPTPVKLSVIIKNSPPSVAFDINSPLPSKTLPVATVLFSGTDLDGNGTIKEFYVALNDTSDTSWTKIPNTVSLLTLVGDLSDTSATIVSAKLKSGVNAEDLNVRIKNFRLNQNNVIYLFCSDISGARSGIVRMPDTTKTWFVRKPVGRRKLLLVDDYGSANPNPDVVYKTALQQSFNSQGISYGDFDTLDLIGQPIRVTVATPMILETMKLYNLALWYGRLTNLRYAQQTIPAFINQGGKAIFITGFENFVSSDELSLGFAPIDSLLTSYRINDSTISPGFIPRVYSGSKILPVDSAFTNPHPLMLFDRTAIFGSYAVEPGPTDTVIYRLNVPVASNSEEKWKGNPAVGVLSNNRRLFFFSMPLHLMNTTDPNDGKLRLSKFFERIFRGDFGD